MSDDRDLIVQGFDEHFRGEAFSRKEGADYAQCVKGLRLPRHVERQILSVVSACVTPLKDNEDTSTNRADGGRVAITAQHAISLAAMVEWFKGMVKAGHKLRCFGDCNESLTTAYCDELLEDLVQ